MRHPILLIAVCLSLFACGKQEKKASPFGRTGNPQEGGDGGGRSQANFEADCRRQGGTLMRSNALCQKPYRRLSMSDITFDGNESFKLLSIQNVPAGAIIWGNISGGSGQVARIYLNGTQLWWMSEDRALTAQPIVNGGTLEVKVFRATYTDFNVLVDECFTRTTAPAPCET